MANAYSVKLPLEEGQLSIDNYNTALVDVARQNIKMILLTTPGERIMLPDFGVGFRRFLFQQNNVFLANDIKNAIQQQIAKYAAGIKIEDLQVITDTGELITNIYIKFSLVSFKIFNQEFILTNL
jgi:phage baseplate assembly protein W